MSRKKVSTTIYLTPEQLDGLQKLSAKTRVPMAVYIREAVDVFLKARASELQEAASPSDPDV